MLGKKADDGGGVATAAVAAALRAQARCIMGHGPKGQKTLKRGGRSNSRAVPAVSMGTC